MLLAVMMLARFAGPALAEIDGRKITLGILTDLIGSSATAADEGSVVAAQLAAEAVPVMAAMKARPADDDAFGKGSVRADGRALHDFHLFQVKKRSGSRGPPGVRGTITS